MLFISVSSSPPQCKSISLERGPDGLGFSIVGGFGSPHGDLPIYVKTVFSKVTVEDKEQIPQYRRIVDASSQVCVSGGRVRGWASEARRSNHRCQRSEFGGRHSRRGRLYSEENQRNRHTHCAVINTHGSFNRLVSGPVVV